MGLSLALNARAIAQQGWRFVRIWTPLFVAQVALINGPVTRAVLLPLIPATIEVAYRQWRPVRTVQKSIQLTPPKAGV